jgi:hypothetical protein
MLNPLVTNSLLVPIPEVLMFHTFCFHEMVRRPTKDPLLETPEDE